MCMVDGTQCPSSVNLLDGDDVMVMTEAAFCTLHATPLERGPSWMVRPPARPPSHGWTLPCMMTAMIAWAAY